MDKKHQRSFHHLDWGTPYFSASSLSDISDINDMSDIKKERGANALINKLPVQWFDL
jgi:hypothetical protein